MTTVEILRKARDHIAQPGMWWQGGFSPSDENGKDGIMNGEPCCAWGALMWADRDQYYPAYELLNRIVQMNGHGHISTFNDAPGRTQAEVVALFDRAIELAEREDAP